MMAAHATFTMKGSPSATCAISMAAMAAGADMAGAGLRGGGLPSRAVGGLSLSLSLSIPRVAEGERVAGRGKRAAASS